MQNITKAVLKGIHRRGRGYVFTPHDVIRHGSRAAIDQALSRLARDGKIRRLRHGLYDYPRISLRLGPLAPDPASIAAALARKTGSRVIPSGAYAANALGLSTQVPARSVYLTDGPNKTVTVGGQTIRLKRTSGRYFGHSTLVNMAIQAMRFLGPDALDHAMTQRIRTALPDSDRTAMAKAATTLPGWMTPHISLIAA